MYITGIALVMMMASPSTHEQRRAAFNAWAQCVDHHVRMNARISAAHSTILAQKAMAACQNEGQIVADQVHGLSPDRPDENNNFLRAAEQTLFEIAVKTAEDVRRER